MPSAVIVTSRLGVVKISACWFFVIDPMYMVNDPAVIVRVAL